METRLISSKHSTRKALYIQDLSKADVESAEDELPSLLTTASPKLRRITFMNSPKSKADEKEFHRRTTTITEFKLKELPDFSPSPTRRPAELPSINDKLNKSDLFDSNVMNFYIHHCFDKESIEDKLNSTGGQFVEGVEKWKPFSPPRLESISNKYANLKNRRVSNNKELEEPTIKEGVARQTSLDNSGMEERTRTLDQTINSLFTRAITTKICYRPRRQNSHELIERYNHSPDNVLVRASYLKRNNITLSESLSVKTRYPYVKIGNITIGTGKLSEFEYKQAQDKITGKRN